MKKPKVSVVMPVYNGEVYLRNTMDFILSQTYKDLRLLISYTAILNSTQSTIHSFSDSRIKSAYQSNWRSKTLNQNIILNS